MSFRLVGRRHLATGVFLRLERIHLLAPDGLPVARDVVRHPGGVAILPVGEDRIWFVVQERAPYRREVLEIPAGKIDPSDTTPVEAARRELAEELGAFVDRLETLGVMYPSPGYTDEVIHLYLAEGIVPRERQPDGAEERFAQVASLSIEEALSRVERGEIPDAKTQLALLLWARRMK